MRPIRGGLVVAATMLSFGLSFLPANSVPRFSLNDLIDSSDFVASGVIERSWTAWDASHTFIWTHYALRISAAYKGSPGGEVEIAEPGGEVAGEGMAVAGALRYSTGEQVFLFLRKMPNHFLRTTGWEQGKYSIGGSGRLMSSGNSASVLSGMKPGDAGAMVRQRIASGAAARDVRVVRAQDVQ